MPLNVVRIRTSPSDAPRWGLLEGDEIFLLKTGAHSLGDLLREKAKGPLARDSAAPLAPAQVEYLSPVTEPCRLVCQGLNYRDHVLETGGNPDRSPFNLIFRKASSAITAPRGDIIRPDFVHLLDYEVELGVIIGAEIAGATTITNENLAQYVAGIVLTNDVSARDIQIPQNQWFKGKSYPTFCPAGPVACLLEPDEIEAMHDLEIELSVNGERRQRSNTGNLIHRPAETLSELSTFMKLSPGDLLLTGTPAGVALKAPPKILRKIGQLLMDEAAQMRFFVKKQRRNPAYLRDGDVVEARIYSRDGRIDLGQQRNIVRRVAK